MDFIPRNDLEQQLLNLGWEVGMDFDADAVAQLIAQLPSEDAA